MYFESLLETRNRIKFSLRIEFMVLRIKFRNRSLNASVELQETSLLEQLKYIRKFSF